MLIDPAKHIPRLAELGEAHGFVLESKEAPRPRGRITYRCPRGHEVSVIRDTALYSNWKGECQSCIFEDRLVRLRQIVNRHGGKIISRKKNFLSTDKILLECASGYRWNKTIYALLEGTWCSKCFVDKRRITLDDANKLASSFGGRCLSQECDGSTQTLEWQCREGHRWARNYQEQLKQPVFCSTCLIPTGRGDRTKVSFEERGQAAFQRAQQIAIDRRRCLSKTHENLKAPMDWGCVNGLVGAAGPRRSYMLVPGVGFTPNKRGRTRLPFRRRATSRAPAAETYFVIDTARIRIRSCGNARMAINSDAAGCRCVGSNRSAQSVVMGSTHNCRGPEFRNKRNSYKSIDYCE